MKTVYTYIHTYNSGNVGTFFFYKMKTKMISKSHEPLFYYLNRYLKYYAQNELISNLMPATGLKIFGTGGMFYYGVASLLFKTV